MQAESTQQRCMQLHFKKRHPTGKTRMFLSTAQIHPSIKPLMEHALPRVIRLQKRKRAEGRPYTRASF
jgi:hypothetical protein